LLGWSSLSGLSIPTIRCALALVDELSTSQVLGIDHGQRILYIINDFEHFGQRIATFLLQFTPCSFRYECISLDEPMKVYDQICKQTPGQQIIIAGKQINRYRNKNNYDLFDCFFVCFI
jgi:hypothetical protein